MGRRIRKGMRVTLIHGPAAGLNGTVIDDLYDKAVQWDGKTIRVPDGLVTLERESELERIDTEPRK